MTRPRPTIVCAACGETREHRAHGWCQPCYRRWNYRGRPADGPPPVRLLNHHDVQGTPHGWDLHMRRGTEPCTPCREAHNAAVLAHYHEKGRPMPAHRIRHYTQARTDWSPDEQRAALTTADHAADAEDCRTLLQALGLAPTEADRHERIGGAA